MPQQLSLFGAPLVEEEKPIVEQPVPPKPVVEQQPAETASGTVIFNDGIIGVKIKKKAPPEVEVFEKKQKTVALVSESNSSLPEVPAEDVLSQKLYYSISEVAGWFKVNTSLIRYWENEFDILKPRKNRKGDRLFRVEDIKNLELIYFLLREKKYSIEGARKYIKSQKEELSQQQQIVHCLTKCKAFLLELKASLAAS
jgi:DNA-binding transcriptional MerR regulator